jgi:GTP-binding protein
MDFFSLGLGDPMPLSALTGSGAVGDLLDKIVSYFPPLNGKKLTRDEELYGEDSEDTHEDLATKPMSVAIIGRPNVGKSSITNMLCGQKRAIVSEVPGTTRDAVDTTFNYKGRELTLIDTAGIRRKSRVDYGIEAFSVVRSLRAIDRADVVALVLDASMEISDQDQKLASKIEEAGKACVIVLNKWDLVEDKSSGAMKRISEDVKAQLRSIAYAEVVFTSVLTKVRVQKIIEACERTFLETHKRVTTGLVNQIISESVALVPPPSGKRGKRLKIYYATQVSVAPPTFVLKVSDGKLMARNYEIYLERKLREAFGFTGAPVRIILRSKEKRD